MTTTYHDILAPGRLLHEPVVHWGELAPTTPAVDENGRVTTYAALADRMTRFAAALAAVGTRRHDRVGVLLDSGADAYAAMLGAMRADACYVALNPTFPAARLAVIIDDAAMVAVISSVRHLDALRETAAIIGTKRRLSLILVDGPAEALRDLGTSFDPILDVRDLKALSSAPAPSRNIEEDLAYLMYTSGSTGKPKGVMVSHRNVKAFFSWVLPTFGLSSSDRFSNHSMLSFDMSVFDVFGAFFAGGCICPVADYRDRAFPADFIVRNRISVWYSVPSVLGLMLRTRTLTVGAFESHLRLAVFAGEALPASYAAAWLDTQPSVSMYNIYGPTEATVSCTCFHVGKDWPLDERTSVPIGRAAPGTEILILKLDEDSPVAPGETGRLFICGSQLAAGYWRRPDLTARAFLCNPAKEPFEGRMYDTGDLAYEIGDGIIQYAGRVDTQVKIMGHRVELSEIENILACHGAVHEVGVVLLNDPDSRIMAAVAAETAGDEADLEESMLLHCEKLLPSYMIPKQIVFFKELPKNVNGKIDRKAIAAMLADDAS